MIKVEHIDNFNGDNIYLFKMENELISVGILNYGGIIKYFNVKTPDGVKNIVFGINDVDEYLREGNYTSAIIGRVANRISNGEFTLNGKTYHITKNDGVHASHGGTEGFDKRIFDYAIEGDALTLKLVSPDGDQGFEGELTLLVKYKLNKDSLEVKFEAKSDKDTVFAPTYHPYFNLSDHNETIYDTLLKINSDTVALIDKDVFPTGELKSVRSSAFDFTAYKPLGEALFSNDEQIILCGGIDHCYKGNSTNVASAYDKKSKIKLDIFSNLEGVQLYTTNLCESISEDSRFFKHCAFCLEPEFFPNALNVDGFNKPVLSANETKTYYIEYKVSVGEEL